MEQTYTAEVADGGRADLLVQRAIRATGHWEFSPVGAGTAWEDLVTWIEDGDRPHGDGVLDADTVADPAYGCRFSDPAAYANSGPPSQDDTRRPFEACPVS